MTNQEFNKRINKAASMHKHLLNKELSYSKDLQNQEAIKMHESNYKKVIGMLK